MQAYAPNRGLRQENYLGANFQGFNAGGLGRGRGVGNNLQGNFQNGGFLNKGKKLYFEGYGLKRRIIELEMNN